MAKRAAIEGTDETEVDNDDEKNTTTTLFSSGTCVILRWIQSTVAFPTKHRELSTLTKACKRMEMARNSVTRPTIRGDLWLLSRHRCDLWNREDIDEDRFCSSRHGISRRRTCAPSLLLLLLCSGWAHVVPAQEYPLLNTAKFNQSVPARHRHDLCSRQKMLYNDEIELAYALEGIDLNIVLPDHSSDPRDRFMFALDEQGRIPTDYPGLFAVIMDELARRGKFRWRDSFGVIKPLDARTDGNKTWTDILTWSTDMYDVSVEYWSKSIERVAMGVSFPEGWYDSSIIFVERVGVRGEGKRPFNVWNFLTPFEYGVWIVIVVAIFATGLVYWTLEKLDNDADARDLIGLPTGVIFLSAMTFTGHFEFRPNTHVARLVAWSWAFWALITTAAYTANLASFLVSRVQPTFRVVSADQAVRGRMPLCVTRGTWNDIYMENEYGEEVNLVRKATDEETFLALRTSECAAAVTQVETFRSYERNAAVNGDCTLKSSGVTVSFNQGGFATAADPGTLCTSLVSHVLDLHMMRMKMDGFIKQAKEEQLQKASNHVCSNQEVLAAAEGGDADGESAKLGLKEMGGIFVFHGLICAFSILVGLLHYCLRRHHRSKLAGEDVIANTDSPGADTEGSDSNEEEDRQTAAVDLSLRNSNQCNAREEKERQSTNQQADQITQRPGSTVRGSIWDYDQNGLAGLWNYEKMSGKMASIDKFHNESQLRQKSMSAQWPRRRNRKGTVQSRVAKSACQLPLSVLQQEQGGKEDGGEDSKRPAKRRYVSDTALYSSAA